MIYFLVALFLIVQSAAIYSAYKNFEFHFKTRNWDLYWILLFAGFHAGAMHLFSMLIEQLIVIDENSTILRIIGILYFIIVFSVMIYLRFFHFSRSSPGNL